MFLPGRRENAEEAAEHCKRRGTKNVTTDILGMASHMRLHVIHEEVDSIFPHVSGENPAGEFVLKTQ